MLDWKTCLRGGITVVLVFLVIHYWNGMAGIVQMAIGAAVPLLLGCVIAYVVNILMSFYERLFDKLSQGKKVPVKGEKTEKPNVLSEKTEGQAAKTEKRDAKSEGQIKKSSGRWVKLRRPFCLALALLSALAVVVLIIRMILPELADCIRLVLERLPGEMNAFSVWLSENLQLQEWLSEDAIQAYSSSFQNIDWQNLVRKVVDWLASGFGNAMTSILAIVSSFFSVAVTVMVGFIFAIYLLMGKERLKNQICLLMRTYMGEKLTGKVLYVFKTFDESFHRFIVGQCIEAVILGALCTIGMLLFRFPYASMVGCLIGFTALIPVAGAYIGAIVGAFMIFTVSPLQAVLFIVFIVVLQQLEGNIIYPRVVGASIGLPGIWVLAAVTIGGSVMGIGGMLLGVPLAAGIYQLVKADVSRRNCG